MTPLALGYILLTILMTVLVIFGYYRAMTSIGLEKPLIVKRLSLSILAVCGWLLYTYLMAASGFLKDLSLPPRFPLLLIIPLFIFIGFLFRTKRNSAIIGAIPRSWPIYFQSFRIIVELLFVATVAQGLLHKEVSIEGYNFDMIFGLTAPVICLLVYRLKSIPEKIVLYWNYLGLAVLLSVILLFLTTAFFPRVWGHDTSFIPTGFLDFPFILVAAYLMPLAVFIHILSIVQLKNHGI